MRLTTLRFAFGLLALGLVIVSARAYGEEKKETPKEVVLKGIITCTKCDLGETPDCGHVIKVKDGGKEVLYYFIDKGQKEGYHDKVCTAAKPGSVKGVVSEKEKKMYITPSKEGVKFD